eukprot:6437975-Prymnesium_polylepis.1
MGPPSPSLTHSSSLRRQPQKAQCLPVVATDPYLRVVHELLGAKRVRDEVRKVRGLLDEAKKTEENNDDTPGSPGPAPGSPFGGNLIDQFNLLGHDSEEDEVEETEEGAAVEALRNLQHDEQEMLLLLLEVADQRIEVLRALDRIRERVLDDEPKSEQPTFFFDGDSPTAKLNEARDEEVEENAVEQELREMYLAAWLGNWKKFDSNEREEGGVRVFFAEADEMIGLCPHAEVAAVLSYTPPVRKFINAIVPPSLRVFAPAEQVVHYTRRKVRAARFIHGLQIAYANYKDEVAIAEEKIKEKKAEEAAAADAGGGSATARQRSLALRKASSVTKVDSALAKKLLDVSERVDELQGCCERLLLLCQQVTLTRQEEAANCRIELEKRPKEQHADGEAEASTRSDKGSTRSDRTPRSGKGSSRAQQRPPQGRLAKYLRRAARMPSQGMREGRHLWAKGSGAMKLHHGRMEFHREELRRGAVNAQLRPQRKRLQRELEQVKLKLDKGGSGSTPEEVYMNVRRRLTCGIEEFVDKSFPHNGACERPSDTSGDVWRARADLRAAPHTAPAGGLTA